MQAALEALDAEATELSSVIRHNVKQSVIIELKSVETIHPVH